jgi:hypothetical protein
MHCRHLKQFEEDIVAIVIILTLGVVSLTWFGGHPFLFGSDTNLTLNIKTINEYFYIPSNSGFDAADVNKLTFLLPIGLFLKTWNDFGLPFSASVFEKLLVYISFAFSGFSMYILLSTFKKLHTFAKLFGALFYMFNFYFLWLWIDLSWLPIVYAFFPLVLAIYIKGIDEGKGLSFAVFTAFVWAITLTSGYGEPWVAMNWLAIILYLVFTLLTSRDYEKNKKAIRFTIFLGAAWLALNLFWIVPLTVSFTTELFRHTIQQASASQIFQSNSVNIIDGLRFMGLQSLSQEYKGSLLFPWYSVYGSIPFIVVSFMIPILAFSALILYKNEKKPLFFGILTILALFLVKGSNPPFGSINTFLFSQFNLDFIFRSTYQRFMPYVVLGSSVLITFTISSLLNWKVRIRRARFFPYAVFCLLLALLVGILPFPLWTGSTYDQNGIISSRKVTIPNYYYETAQWLDAQNEQFCVLPLPFPTAYKASFVWNNGSDGYYSKYPLTSISTKSFIINDFGNHTGSTFVRLMIDGAFNDSAILNLFNVKYIFLHRDANWQYIEGNANWVSGTLQQLQLALKSMRGLILDKSFGEIDVYRNIAWQPMVAYSLPRALLDETATSLNSKDFVYFDQFASLSQWSTVAGNWTVYFEDGQSFFNGTGASALGLDIMGTSDLTTEGYFKFGETDSVHYPFVLTSQNGETFCPVVAGANGYFVETGTEQISNLVPYSSNRWYNITLNQDLEKNKYWLWIDNRLLTPTEGLTIHFSGGNPISSSPGNFVKVAIIAGSTLRPSLTEIHNVKIFDPESERDLVANYTTAANLIRQAKVVTIKKVNPVQYEGNIDVTQPSFLVLNENYDSGWILKVNGTEFKPSVGLDFNNLYSIDDTGIKNVVFYYAPQNWFYASTIGSLCFLSFLVGYLFFTKRHRIRLWLSNRFNK